MDRARGHRHAPPRRRAGGIALLDRIANVCYGLLLVTGISMVLAGGLRFEELWISASVGLLVLASILGIVLYGPVARRRRQLVAAGDAASSEYARVTARSTQLGILTTLIVVAIVFMMVTKPGAT